MKNEDITAVIIRKDYFRLSEILNDERFDIDCIDHFFLLHKSISYNFYKAVPLLLSRGAKINLIDSEIKTPLHYACEDKNSEICKLLLDNGSDINIEDKYGNTPLWTAVFNAKGDYEIVEFLMKYYPNPNHKNKSNKSPIDFAIQIHDKHLLDILTAKN